jgi:hypothetical protein
VVGIDLEAPDGHGVVDADVPCGVDGQIGVDRHVADAPCCSAIHLGARMVALVVNATLGATVLLIILRLISGGGGGWRRRW